MSFNAEQQDDRSVAVYFILLLTLMMASGWLAVFAVEADGVIGAAQIVVLLLALVPGVLTGTLEIPLSAAFSILIGLLAVALSLIASRTVSGELLLAGYKVLLLPLLGFLSGIALGRKCPRSLILMLPALLILLGLNLGYAIWQVSVDPEDLVSAGYQYNANIREFSGQVRAFGLLPRDNIFGQVTALLAVLGTWLAVWYRKRRMIAIFVAVIGLVCVVLSTNRTAQGLTVVGLALVLLSHNNPVTRRVGRVTPALLLTAGIIGLSYSLNLGSLDSIYARILVWSELLSRSNLVLGSGPDAAGVTASTLLGGVGTSGSVGDNYYVTIAAQYGVAGILFLFVLIFCFAECASRATRMSRVLVLFLAIFFYVGMLSDNIWEETPTAPLGMFLLGLLVRPREGVDAHSSELPLSPAADDRGAKVR